MQKKQVVSRFKQLFVDFPALLKLIYRLLKDSRVSTVDKALLGGIVVYVINPMDLIPDVIPVIGQIDDAYLIALGLLRLLNRTDVEVLQEHWEGQYDIVILLEEIEGLAVFYLPDRVQPLLVGKLDKHKFVRVKNLNRNKSE